jgi:hypothetical protein
MSKRAFSVTEFCAAYSIGKTKFYEMVAGGIGPRTFKAGHKTLISVEAADDWRRGLEQQSSKPLGTAGSASAP